MERLRRRHTPRRTKEYRSYRSCLRWEFGFSCAFCLLHEADLIAGGAEGWGVMAIEHFVPRSQAPELVNEYSNCFYVCHLCNSARGEQPNQAADGASLLNPCDQSWSDLFVAVEDQIVPREGVGRDASYTCDTYDFNDPRKVRLRRMRRLVIQQCQDFLAASATTGQDLLDHAAEAGDTEAVGVAGKLAAMRRLAHLELLRFQAIPADHPVECACGSNRHHSLPEGMK
jgi:hypothetical protein